VDIVYYKKAESRVVRVVHGDWVEVEIPGYTERFFVDLGDPASVGPPPLPILAAQQGATGDLYLSTIYLSDNGIAADFDSNKLPPWQGGSFAGFWRYLNSPARTVAIDEAISRVCAVLPSLGEEAASRREPGALARALRRNRALDRQLREAFPQAAPDLDRVLDQIAASLGVGVACGAIRPYRSLPASGRPSKPSNLQAPVALPLRAQALNR
jgi:hypothetical protein